MLMKVTDLGFAKSALSLSPPIPKTQTLATITEMADPTYAWVNNDCLPSSLPERELKEEGGTANTRSGTTSSDFFFSSPIFCFFQLGGRDRKATTTAGILI